MRFLMRLMLWWPIIAISDLETMLCKEGLQFVFAQPRDYLMGKFRQEVEYSRMWKTIGEEAVNTNGKWEIVNRNGEKENFFVWAVKLHSSGDTVKSPPLDTSEMQLDIDRWLMEINLNLNLSVFFWCSWTCGNEPCSITVYFLATSQFSDVFSL